MNSHYNLNISDGGHMKRLFLFLTAAFLLSSICLAANPTRSGDHSRIRPNGYCLIYLFDDNDWKLKDRVYLDQFYRSRTVDFGETDAKKLKIKIKRVGGETGHIDLALLGSEAPTETSLSDPVLSLKKLSKKDFDVVEFNEQDLILTFPIKVPHIQLNLNARIEGKKTSQSTFLFPGISKSANRELKNFYSYQFNSSKLKTTVDGNLREYFGVKPLFNEYFSSIGGHPSGQTYGWVSNDDKYLYAAIDFTPNNTFDPEEDYAALLIQTPAGLKEFKVTVAQTKYGAQGFNYTEKVPYQHKVYEFKIPLSEIGPVIAEKKRGIQLAFGVSHPIELKR